MNFYLIDYENVNDAGLNGIASLTEDDSVTIFYSEYADKMSFGLHRRINESKANIEYRRIITGTKNALDFQLSSFLGYLIAKNPDSSFFIVSKDSGYKALKNIWQKSKIYCISEIAGRREIEKAIEKAEEESKQESEAQPEPEREEEAFEASKGEQSPVKILSDDKDDKENKAYKADKANKANKAGKRTVSEKMSASDKKTAAEGLLQRYGKKRAVKEPKRKNDEVKKQIKKMFKDKEEAADVYDIIQNSPTRQVVNNELTKKYGFDSGKIYKKIKMFIKDLPGQ